MSVTKKLVGFLIFISSCTLLLSNCNKNTGTPSTKPSPLPIATQITKEPPTPTPTVRPVKEEEAEIPTTSMDSQSLANPHNFSNATFSIPNEQSGPIPSYMKQQFLAFGGGGGASRAINFCINNHYGIAYYDEPVLVKGLMAETPYRTLQLSPSKIGDGMLPVLFPDLCVCGFEMEDKVTLSILNPSQEMVYESHPLVQQAKGTNEEPIAGTYCIESNIVREYDFLPGEPFGLYEVRIESDSGNVSYTFELGKDSAPYLYYSNRLGGYVVGGLDPHETVSLSLFYPKLAEPTGPDFEQLVDNINFKTDQRGFALIMAEDKYETMVIFRGNPTTDYFQVLGYNNSQGFLPGTIRFDDLIEQYPDNPYVHYYSRDQEKFLEMAPDSDLANVIEAEERSFDLYSQANTILGHENNSNPSETDLSMAIDLLSEAIALLNNDEIKIQTRFDSLIHQALRARATSYIELGEYELAIADLLTIVDLKRSFYDAVYSFNSIGDIHLLNSDYESAIESFENIIETASRTQYYRTGHYQVITQGYLKIGCTYVQTGDSELANESFWQASETLLTGSYNNRHRTGSYTSNLEFEPESYLEYFSDEIRQDCIEKFNTQKMIFLEQNPLAIRATLHPIDEMLMVYVPAGEFMMGSTQADDGAKSTEFPQHIVYLDGYWIDSHEVRLSQYNLCVASGVCNPPATSSPDSNDPHSAATNVTWGDAAAYCTWAGRRLPTEAEWEKAARGTDARIYPWGNSDPDTCTVSPLNVNYNSEGVRTPLYRALDFRCIAPSGAVDMAGNVWEWVADYYGEDYYANSPIENPQGPETGEERVLRGGSWTSSEVADLRTANRWSRSEDFSSDAIGFRCALNGTP